MNEQIDSLDFGGMSESERITEAIRSAMLRHEAVLQNQLVDLHRLYWTHVNSDGNVLASEKLDDHAKRIIRDGDVANERSSSHPPGCIDLNVSVDEESEEEAIATSSTFDAPLVRDRVLGAQFAVVSDLTSCWRTDKDSYSTLSAKLPSEGQNEDTDMPPLSTLCSTSKSSITQRIPRFEFDLNTVQLAESSSDLDNPEVLDASVPSSLSLISNGSLDEKHASPHQNANSWKESNNMLLRESSILRNATMVGFELNGAEKLRHNSRNSEEHATLRNGFNDDTNDAKRGFAGLDLNEPPQLDNTPEGVSAGFSGVSQQWSNEKLSIPVDTLYNSYYNAAVSLEPSVLNNRTVLYLTSSTDITVQSPHYESNLQAVIDVKKTEGEKSEEDTLSSKIYGNCKIAQGRSLANNELSGKLPLGDQSFETNSSNSYCMGCKDQQQPTGILNSGDVNNPVVKNVLTVLQDPVVQGCTGESQKCSLQADEVVLIAAESLVQIFSKASAHHSYSCAEEGPAEMEIDTTCKGPQYSSDSLETIVLALQEEKEDECSSPALSIVTETVLITESRRLKSRSGRRLQDFQKDILPGLVSLSRHEICEDLHSFAQITKMHQVSRKSPSKANMARNRRSGPYRSGRRRQD